MTELAILVGGASQELGFDYFALLHHRSLSTCDEHLIRIDNYPVEWTTELVGSGLILDDPVHLASSGASTAFYWSELDRMIPLSPGHRAILARSRDHGIGEGLTVPVNVPGEPAGSCSFAVRKNGRLHSSQLLDAELIGLHAFDAARRLTSSVRRRPHLSRREVQCLRLVAAGKTDAEIAIILGISRETVRQYVKAARAAYDVITRTQLAVLGLRDHWVSFDEATRTRH